MMKKKLFVLPVLAVLFTACTNDELVVEENKVQQNEQDGAIAFDAYLNRAVTRAGAAPEDPIFVILNGDKLKVTIEYDVLTSELNLAGTLNDGTTKGSVV